MARHGTAWHVLLKGWAGQQAGLSVKHALHNLPDLWHMPKLLLQRLGVVLLHTLTWKGLRDSTSVARVVSHTVRSEWMFTNTDGRR
jgi:hypothetical protein